MGNILGLPHRVLGRQYTGVFGTKYLIKWLFPDAVLTFDNCAKSHDEAYKTIDWNLGASATLKADNNFRACCLAAAKDDPQLKADAELFYKACRKWGRARSWLWKIGVRY